MCRWSDSSSPGTVVAMVVEQRRTNRLLQSVLFGVIGFVVGALVMQIIFRWRGL